MNTSQFLNKVRTLATMWEHDRAPNSECEDEEDDDSNGTWVGDVRVGITWGFTLISPVHVPETILTFSLELLFFANFPYWNLLSTLSPLSLEFTPRTSPPPLSPLDVGLAQSPAKRTAGLRHHAHRPWYWCCSRVLGKLWVLFHGPPQAMGRSTLFRQGQH